MESIGSNALGSCNGYVCVTCGCCIPYGQWHSHYVPPVQWLYGCPVADPNSALILVELKAIRKLLEDRDEGLKGL